MGFPAQLLSIISGPLTAWLNAAAGPSIAVDGALHAAGAVATIIAAHNLGARAITACLAGALAAASPAVLSALPNDARAAILSSALGMAGLAVASHNTKYKNSTDAAAILLFILSFLAGSPAAAGFAFAGAGAMLSDPARARRPAAIITFAVFAAFIFAQAIVTLACSPLPALSAAGYSILPIERTPDLFLYNSADAPAGVFAAAAIGSVATAAAFLLPTLRPAAFLFGGGMLGLALGATERQFLHDRGPAAFAPAAALFISFSLEFVLRSARPAALAAAGLAVIITFAATGAARFALAKDTERYLETSLREAPASPFFHEVYGQVLASKARAPGIKSAERIQYYRNAAAALEAGAPLADPVRRFRMLYAAANSALLAGDSTKTAELLPSLATFASDDEARGDVAVLRARVLEAQDKSDDAIVCLRAANEQYPNAQNARRYYLKLATSRISTRLAAARASKDAKGAAECLADLDKLAASFATDLRADAPPKVRAPALAARGRASLARGAVVEAARDFNDAKRCDPQLADAYIGAAEVYLSQNLLDGAASELRLGLEATQPTPPAELLVSLAAVKLQIGGDPDGVIQLVEIARQADPGASHLIKTIAAARAALAEHRLEKGDLAGAEEATKAALADAPDSAHAFAVYGKIREQQKRVDESVLYYEKAFALDKSDDVREKLAGAVKTQAMSHLYAKDRSGAVAAFLRLRDLHSKTVDIGSGDGILADEARREFEAGVECTDKSNPAAAKQHFARSIELLPENFYALNQLATLEAEANEVEKCIDHFLRAIDIAKAQNIDLSDFGVHYNLAQQYRLDGKLALAAATLNEYLKFGKGRYAAKCQAMLEIIEKLQK